MPKEAKACDNMLMSMNIKFEQIEREGDSHISGHRATNNLKVDREAKESE